MMSGNANVKILSNPTIGKEFFAKSIVAVVAASLLILVYIAVRFKKIGG